MASLLPDPLLDISGRGPAPNQNFYQFCITKLDAIWRWWKISPRTVDRQSRPGEVKQSHEDFLDDNRLHNDVRMVFGVQILEYAKALCEGNYDYLERLPDPLLLRIISYLELEDVGQLGRTSHRFRKLCGSEEFWEQLVRQHCNTVSAEVASLASQVGWRTIFFTNKLQLQKLVSRRRLKTEGQHEGQASNLETEEAECSEGNFKIKQTSYSEEESHLDIGNVKPDTDTGHGFESSSHRDADLDPNPELEAGSDSSKSVPDQFHEQMSG